MANKTTSKYRVLTLHKDGKDYVFTSTFGQRSDAYLWNLAWVREHHDMKSIGPEGRSWFGDVNETGIRQLKELGYKIEAARVEVITNEDE